MRIAVFGGSFDPPHIAHEQIVTKALKNLDIDKIFVVPAYLNPFKKSFNVEPKKRYLLLKKLFKDNEKVIICDYEILQGKKVPTYETIEYLKSLYNLSKIYLILGSDNYNNINKWYKAKELTKNVEFVIAKRDGFLDENSHKIKILDININISSTILRDKINVKFIPEKIINDVKSLYKK